MGEKVIAYSGVVKRRLPLRLTRSGSPCICSAKASLTFIIEDQEKLHSCLFAELKATPILSADDIYSILVKQMEADLDNDMVEYCNADDYYEPYWEDFVGEGTYDSERKIDGQIC